MVSGSDSGRDDGGSVDEWTGVNWHDSKYTLYLKVNQMEGYLYRKLFLIENCQNTQIYVKLVV